MADRGVKVPVLNNMALCLQRQGQLERAISMCDQVLQIEEFNSKATSRKLSYLLEAGQLDRLKRELKQIKLQPSCFDNFVRQTAMQVEKELNK